MGHIGWGEMLLIGGVALLVFGPAKLPELGRSLGRAFRDFKNAVSGLDTEEKAPETVLPPKRRPARRKKNVPPGPQN